MARVSAVIALRDGCLEPAAREGRRYSRELSGRMSGVESFTCSNIKIRDMKEWQEQFQGDEPHLAGPHDAKV